MDLTGLVTLPLNWDQFTDLIISLANSAALPNFTGVLDATGQGTAQLDSMGPLPPTAVGLVMNYAFLLYYTPSFFPYDYVSNPVTVEVTP